MHLQAGHGKSTFIRLLGKEWFNDSLDTVKGKEAYEQLQGSWLIEMGELTASVLKQLLFLRRGYIPSRIW